MNKITLSEYYNTYEEEFFHNEKEGIIVFTRDNDISKELIARLDQLKNSMNIIMLEIDADEAKELMGEDKLDVSGVPGVALFMENMRYMEYNCSNDFDYRHLIRDLKEWFSY